MTYSEGEHWLKQAKVLLEITSNKSTYVIINKLLEIIQYYKNEYDYQD